MVTKSCFPPLLNSWTCLGHPAEWIWSQFHAQLDARLALQLHAFKLEEVSMNYPIRRGPDEKFCFECGAVIRARAEICPKCGVRQAAQKQSLELQGRNRIVAALLAIFFGGIGLHKFYLGRIGAGILYLLFCWTMIPFFVGLIEGVIYLSMNDDSFSAQYA
jgi:TM2 domain-containing membrane protein YozV/ribosomal protein L40E